MSLSLFNKGTANVDFAEFLPRITSIHLVNQRTTSFRTLTQNVRFTRLVHSINRAKDEAHVLYITSNWKDFLWFFLPSLAGRDHSMGLLWVLSLMTVSPRVVEEKETRTLMRKLLCISGGVLAIRQSHY